MRRFRRAPDRPDGDPARRVVRRRSSCSRSTASQFPGLDHPERAASGSIPTDRSSRRSSGYTGEISEAELDEPAVRRLQGGPADRKAGARASSTSRSCAAGRAAQFVEVDARGRVVARPGARPDLSPVAGARPAHEHRSRPAALRREPLRRLAAGRRGGDGPEDRGGARAVQRAELRPQPLHRRHFGDVLRLAAHRSATAAVQQGAAGAVSAGLDVEARDGDHGPGDQRR